MEVVDSIQLLRKAIVEVSNKRIIKISSANACNLIRSFHLDIL